jgi:hypothetical protein
VDAAARSVQKKEKEMISDNAIDEVLWLAEHHFDQTSVFRGATRKKSFLEALNKALHNKQSGIIEGACSRCLGTGYEPNKDSMGRCYPPPPCSEYFVTVTLKIPRKLLGRLTKKAIALKEVELVAADWDRAREVWKSPNASLEECAGKHFALFKEQGRQK